MMKKEQINSKYRPQIHLDPPTGWLNDPNGLCQLGGTHHIFFQYSPDDPRGGNKYWGHYETKDFINYIFTGIFLSPDTKEDKDGVYSGSAYLEDGTMYLYYTGNVKHPGDYDYIYQGREGNTLLVTSRDAVTSTEKEVLLKNADYPNTLSNHVRDPKVFCANGKYYMVLGARTKKDEGCVLLYSSVDKRNWNFEHYIKKENFGYMWECPDLFSLGGRQFLSTSPQGLETEEFRFQNVYQSGYFDADGDLLEDGTCLRNFTEWDYGFDFYAPQTYEDESGRRILIGWMGVPDVPYDHDPSLDEGWQHMLTLPRELTYDEEKGRILQNPVQEITKLRKETVIDGAVGVITAETITAPYELLLQELAGEDFELSFDGGVHISYEAQKRIVQVFFDTGDGEGMGYGRTVRKLQLPEGEQVNDVRVFVDTCCLEIFLNHGAYVFTTKFYSETPSSHCLALKGEVGKVTIYKLESFRCSSISK